MQEMLEDPDEPVCEQADSAAGEAAPDPTAAAGAKRGEKAAWLNDQAVARAIRVQNMWAENMQLKFMSLLASFPDDL